MATKFEDQWKAEIRASKPWVPLFAPCRGTVITEDLMEGALIPLVLRARRLLPPESPPSMEMRFDEVLQLWMNRTSGRPVVLEYVRQSHDGGPCASNLGETVNTRTHEGVDQSERILGSDLGETVITKTQEGIDTTESSWVE